MTLPPAVPQWLAEILAEPTCNIPEAGRALGMKSRPRAYAAAASGDMPTILVGAKRRRVPTAWLREVLRLPEPELAPARPMVRRRLTRRDD